METFLSHPLDRPGAPVFTPVTAQELNRGINPNEWNIATMPDRLKKRGDLWRDFFLHPVRLANVVNRFSQRQAAHGA